LISAALASTPAATQAKARQSPWAAPEGSSSSRKPPLRASNRSHAPHTASAVTRDAWSRKYPRERAAFPTAWSRTHKFWPSVGRIDNAFGDRNLVCACPPMSDYM
jgi:hypothetical protein